MNQPKNQTILNLWKRRQDLLEEVRKYTKAIEALQELCEHPNDEDVSKHGSPMMECPDCGRGMV